MDVTKSGFKKCQHLQKLVIKFRDETESEYWVIKGSIYDYSYNTETGMFRFYEYKSIDEGDEFNGMFHGGGAMHESHNIPIAIIKDVIQKPEQLFAGEGLLYIWRDPEDSKNFVVAAEEWVENLV
jgi:hypothetical protein